MTRTTSRLAATVTRPAKLVQKTTKKRPAALSAALILRTHCTGGADAVAVLCGPLPINRLAAIAESFDGRASAPWQQTALRSRYARCGTCGEVHHYGIATVAHQKRHTRERIAKRILAAEIARRQEMP